MHPRIDYVDRHIGQWMETYGHVSHRVGLAMLFVWFGLLKQFGHETASSLLAHTVYWGEPEVVVPVLGWWEVAIGVSLLSHRLIRVGLLLLLLRLPGTVLALILQSDVCFDGNVLVPTPEGQYLLKDLALFTAAMVIGGTVRKERSPHIVP